MSDSRATDNNMNLNQIAYENVAGNRTFDELCRFMDNLQGMCLLSTS